MQSCDPALGTTRPHPSCRRWNGGVSAAGHVTAGRSSRAGRLVPGQGGAVLISVDDGRALYFDDGTPVTAASAVRSEELTSELQSRQYLVCRLLLEKKNNNST